MNNPNTIIDFDFANIDAIASTDPTRYMINGVYLDNELGVICATDGRILMKAPILETTCDHKVTMGRDDWKRMVAEHKRTKQKRICLHVSPDKIEWDGGYCTPLDGAFPNYAQVIPRGGAKSFSNNAVIFNTALLGRVAKAIGATPKKGKMIQITNHGENGPFKIDYSGKPSGVVIVLMPGRALK